MQPHGPGDECNVPVSQRRQVLHSLADPVVVINLEQTDTGPVGPLIHKHERNVALGELLQERLFYSEGHYRNTLGLAFQHTANAKIHAPRIIVSGADQDLVSVLNRYVFESLYEFRKERIGDLGNNESE